MWSANGELVNASKRPCDQEIEALSEGFMDETLRERIVQALPDWKAALHEIANASQHSPDLETETLSEGFIDETFQQNNNMENFNNC